MASNPEHTIIDLREAVQSARHYFADLFSEEHYSNVRLEEVALSENDNTWNITLGYDVVQEMDLPGSDFVRKIREYKVFEVDATHGSVKAMKIRKV